MHLPTSWDDIGHHSATPTSSSSESLPQLLQRQESWVGVPEPTTGAMLYQKPQPATSNATAIDVPFSVDSGPSLQTAPTALKSTMETMPATTTLSTFYGSSGQQLTTAALFASSIGTPPHALVIPRSRPVDEDDDWSRSGGSPAGDASASDQQLISPGLGSADQSVLDRYSSHYDRMFDS